MALTLAQAEKQDAEELLHIHLSAGRALAAQFGAGPWSGGMTVMGMLLTMRQSSVFAARDGAAKDAKIVGTFALSTRKPRSIDASYFTPCERPVYLTAMAVHPEQQRQGVGSFCIAQARRLVHEWPGDAIRLDAWDAPAGAGEFYSKCGLREVGRNIYRGARLIYFETSVFETSV